MTLLPRPMALYVSKREDATEWVSRLRSAGLQRVTEVTGKSGDEERRVALEGWSARRSGSPERPQPL